MKNRRYDSLRNRLVLPFALLGLIVSALLSGITYGLVADLEARAIERMLRFEMESFRFRKTRNPNALQPSTTLIYGYFLPSPDLPSFVLPAPGTERVEKHRIDDRSYTALVGEIAGEPYVLFYDRTFIDSNLVQLAWLLVGGTLLMTVIATLVGHRLARQVVRPISRLLDEISAKSAAIDPRAGAPLSFSAADYPENEIGGLVQALDQFAMRLYGFVQREGYFASDVSHELRTPVAVIRGAVEVLIESPDVTEPVRQRLRTVHRQAVRMGDVLEAMLLLAREGGAAGDPACAMADVIDDAIADCAPSLSGRPVSLVREIRARPIVAVERSLAYVVISNLLRNACAHTREGSITVRLFDDRVEIVDTGIGIAEDRFPEVFERYVKGEESPGSGLGLSIVARVTRLIKWKTAIDSCAGVGTRVVVSFPTAPADEPEKLGSLARMTRMTQIHADKPKVPRSPIG